MVDTQPGPTTTTAGGVTIRRLAPTLGAEIHGMDLAAADDTMADRIRALLLEHKVLFFPGQHLALDAHVALGRFFGPLEGHPNVKNAFLEHPEVFELAATRGGIADEWHTDLTFMDQPSVMSILNMITCPEIGGDTMWTSLTAAYDELSAPMQDLCNGLTALHDAHPHDRSDAMTIHPVVRIHPDTDERCLYVNQHFTRRLVELSAEESDVLLDHLVKFVAKERFTVRYHWTPGTIAIWDNRCTQHLVLNDFEGERIIQRVTVMGDVVEGDPPRWPHWSGATRPGATSRFDRQLRRFLKKSEGVEAPENQHDSNG
ncbi:MAG: taurine dioxygenase [Actinomycetia bacterium]|nr:taurine dioxygenase [Actinomycetes bacterium]